MAADSMLTDRRRKAAGQAGEDAAAQYLAQLGYRIAARNWRCTRGELDIVAIQGEIIAFVEVKTRREGAMVSPLEAVGSTKQRRVVTAAALYLSANHCHHLQPRFDVVAVTVKPGGLEVEHIPAAYTASDFY